MATIKSDFLLLVIAIYHILFSYFAYFFTQYNFADANKYWFVTYNPQKFITSGYMPFREYLIYYLNYIPAAILGLPQWVGFAIYSIIGLYGIYYLYKILNHVITIESKRKYLFTLPLLLLPSLHFWTGLLGKEPVCFLGISLAFYGFFAQKRKELYFLIGILILLFIRPHIALLLAFSIFSVLIFKKKKNSKKIIFFGIGLIAVSAFILSQTSWVENFSIAKIKYVIDFHHKFLSTTDTYVPLENYNWFYKIFTFYFRPLPFEIQNLYGWAVGLENIFVLIIGVFAIFCLAFNIKNYSYKLNLQPH